jgi:hypothetical protein
MGNLFGWYYSILVYYGMPIYQPKRVLLEMNRKEDING